MPVRKEQALKLKLVLQSSVASTTMVAMGEAPVLRIDDCGTDFQYSKKDWVETLVTAMNFLKCGCPEVIIYSETLVQYEEKRDEESRNNLEKEINEFLRSFGDHTQFFVAEVMHGGGVIHVIRAKYSKK